MCCNFAVDQFDAGTHLFSIRSSVALFAAVPTLLGKSQQRHLHFSCSALSAAVNSVESDFAVEH